MEDRDFETLVSQALDGLPAYFLAKLENVEVVIETWPTAAHLQAAKIHPQTLLLGLYQGVPQPRRTLSVQMPDKITIFSGPILLLAHTPSEVKSLVTKVVKHEIAHHFGMSDAELHQKGW